MKKGLQLRKIKIRLIISSFVKVDCLKTEKLFVQIAEQ